MPKIKVVVADDERYALDGIAEMIDATSEFCVVGKAEDGESALALIREKKPELVVTDIKMPVMDGLGLIDKCLEEVLPVTIIVISAYDDREYLRAAIRSSIVYDYLFKPFLKEDLIAALHGSYRFHLKSVGSGDSDETGSVLFKAITGNDYASIEELLNRVFENAGNLQDLKNRCYGWIVHVHNNTFANNKLASFDSQSTMKKIFETLDREELLVIMKEYFRNCCDRYVQNDSITVLVKSCMRIMEREVANEDLNLNYCADKLSVTANYLSTRFSRDMGESFSSYLNNLRIRKAKEYLSDVSLKVYEIASLVGISDVSYFNRLFKETEGMTPLQYRKRSFDEEEWGQEF